MNPFALERLLEQVRTGKLEVSEACERLRHLPFEDLGYAKVDHHRSLRTGLPEVVYAPGKTPEHIIEIVRSLKAKRHNALITRLDPNTAERVQEALPGLRYHPVARVATLTVERRKSAGKGLITVVAAGTADLPVAEEAAVTAEFFGNRVQRVHDVGVAGLHRLLAHLDTLRRARVVVVVAGMEGALPSVVGGLVGRPIIAVPTSVGYGVNFGGLAALLAMLNSCAAGITVVNIDNGFGAAVAATLINRT